MAGAPVPLPAPGAPAAPEAKRRRRQPRWLRWVARRFHRHMPVALLTLAVGVLVVIGVLDFLPGVRAEIEGFAGDWWAFVGLTANLLVPGIAAARPYFRM